MRHSLKYNCLLWLFIFCLGYSQAQTTEDFEDETPGATTFSDNGQSFTITNGGTDSTYDIESFGGGGWNGTAPDNQFIDNSSGLPPQNDGSSFTVSTTDNTAIFINSLYLFVSTRALADANPTTVTITGRLNGSVQYTIVKNSGFASPVTFSPNNGFTFFDFTSEGGIDNSNIAVDEISITSTGLADYLALDAFNWEFAPPPCIDPTIPTLTQTPTTVCVGSTASISITGDLNDATAWQIYTNSCGGVNIGSTTSGTFNIPGVINVPTTFFVRGEGGCITTGSCATITIVPQAIINASVSAPADLCIDAGVQAGLSGGTPTGGVYSGPGVTDDGNGTTYSFDPVAAGVGVHTITYTPFGECVTPGTNTVEVYALPTISFTAPADLTIDAGIQTGIGGGAPSGGVYSGSGVTDDGNGMTYNFDPAVTGIGVHTITYTFIDANGCTSSASDDIEVTPALSIDEVSQNNRLDIYPNPVTNILDFITTDVVIESITIIDMIGKVISKQKLSAENTLDVSNLKNGIYILKIHTDKGLQMKRILKK